MLHNRQSRPGEPESAPPRPSITAPGRTTRSHDAYDDLDEIEALLDAGLHAGPAPAPAAAPHASAALGDDRDEAEGRLDGAPSQAGPAGPSRLHRLFRPPAPAGAPGAPPPPALDDGGGLAAPAAHGDAGGDRKRKRTTAIPADPRAAAPAPARDEPRPKQPRPRKGAHARPHAAASAEDVEVVKAAVASALLAQLTWGAQARKHVAQDEAEARRLVARNARHGSSSYTIVSRAAITEELARAVADAAVDRAVARGRGAALVEAFRDRDPSQVNATIVGSGGHFDVPVSGAAGWVSRQGGRAEAVAISHLQVDCVMFPPDRKGSFHWYPVAAQP